MIRNAPQTSQTSICFSWADIKLRSRDCCKTKQMVYPVCLHGWFLMITLCDLDWCLMTENLCSLLKFALLSQRMIWVTVLGTCTFPTFCWNVLQFSNWFSFFGCRVFVVWCSKTLTGVQSVIFFHDMHCRSSETYETHLRLSKYSFDNTINILVHLVIHQKRVQPGYSEQVHVPCTLLNC